MPCESEFVEISMMVEISAKFFLGIISLLVGLLDRLIIFLISDRKISESAVVLGKRTCQREVPAGESPDSNFICTCFQNLSVPNCHVFVIRSKSRTKLFVYS